MKPNRRTQAIHKKPSAKQQPSQSQAPYPSIITQVNKEDEKKYQILDLLNIYKCCSFLFRCFPSKKQSFSQMVETLPALLEPQLPQFKGKKVLVLDLDETLVHSTFEPVENPDLILPVKIQGMTYRINVIIRPGAEEFLARVGELFEVVVFTASLSEYAEPLVKIIDTTNAVSSLLYRQHCTPLNGIYVKDMTLLGRNIKDIILVDNSPNSFLFQPENAYHIKNFFDDKSDRELYRLANFLDHMDEVDDVRPVEDLRRRFEPQINQKVMKMVKISQEEQDPVDLEDITSINPNNPTRTSMKKRDDEKSSHVETEPDLRRDSREGEASRNRGQISERGREREKPHQRVMPLTERIVVNDRFIGPGMDVSEDIELPSPKESDALINHREADAFFESNSNETDNKDGKKKNMKVNVPPLNKSSSAVFSKFGQVTTVEDPLIDGKKIEDVRILTGIDNLNSPLGRHVKIEFENKMEVKV